MKTYLYRQIVPFQDTDMAGVVHYTRILGYVELAEHACLKDLGIQPISQSGGFPKVHVECDYFRPLRFGDELIVELKLSKFSRKSIDWQFKIRSSDTLCAKGLIVTSFVGSDGKPSEMPQSWESLLDS